MDIIDDQFYYGAQIGGSRKYYGPAGCDILITEVEAIIADCDAPAAPSYPWHPTESDKRPSDDAWRLWQNDAL